MKNIIFLIFTTFLVWGCSSSTEPKPENNSIPVGCNFDRKYSGDYYEGSQGISDMKDRMDILVSHNVQMVTFYWNVYQIEYEASIFVREFIFFKSFTEDELADLINYAHSLGLQVQLSLEILPIVEEPGGWCQGYVDGHKMNIDPSNPHLWFYNLVPEAVACAEFAQNNNIELLNIGQELQNLTSEDYDDYWAAIITAIEFYSGPIVYYMIGTEDIEFNHITDQFWSLWNYVGVTWYPVDFSDSSIPSFSETEQRLSETLVQFLEIVRDATGMKIIIGETSCPSIQFCLQYDNVFKGWDTAFLQNQIMNEQGQANYLKALQSMKLSYVHIILWQNIYNSRHYEPDGIKEDSGATLFKNSFEPKEALKQIQ